ncbi:hypothetical protein [Pedobacter metabolipauper]|uniref:Uncharacterized protein n=1 Tax=Pedobacter metabolipauper TaxID=425513 RepID=A0A4R6SP35_9SPHI|nr:hypothetical protein [Pedobacter metabolipauper]TDQ06238.1 hypothetical protein ATK78_4619 [Pedobacter metabolipauper]
MKLLKPFLKRFFLVAVPILAVYLFAQMAAKENRRSEHPTDVGLGIAFLLVFIFIVMFVAFIADLIIRIRGKQVSLAWMDAGFLLLFSIPITYIGCLIASRDCFCKWVIDTIDLIG